MKIIAIDTATEACSVALYLDGTVQERYRLAPRQHAALVLPMVDELLAATGLTLSALDAVAFGRGPGSFTGVRIAASVAQGLAFAAELPVIGVSTLAALAQGAWREFGWERVAAAIDARMHEVYWGGYQFGADAVMEAVIEEGVFAPAATPLLPDAAYHGVGSGWDAYGQVLAERHHNCIAGRSDGVLPHAQDVARLAVAAFCAGEMVAPELAVPVYLRDQVTHQHAG